MNYLENKIYILHYLFSKKIPKLTYKIVCLLEYFAKIARLRKKRIPVIIYGEPRSGTSFITGLISRMGYHLGPFVWLPRENNYNPDGFFECIPIQKIIDKRIEELGIEFENNLPKEPQRLSKEDKQQITKILNKGNITVLKNNKLSLFADSLSEIMPEAIWIHVKRNSQDVFSSNNKFFKEREINEFMDIYNKRIDLWNQSTISINSIEINYSHLELYNDINNLISKLELIFGINLSKKRKEYCLRLFRPKTKINKVTYS